MDQETPLLTPIPKFSGRLSGDWALHETRLKAYLNASGIPLHAREAGDVLLLSLDGVASLSLCDAASGALSFDTACAYLREQFNSSARQQNRRDAASNALSLRTFRERGRRNELVSDLVNELELLCMRAGITEDEGKRQALIRCFVEFPGAQSILSSTRTYGEAVSEALRWEAIMVRSEYDATVRSQFRPFSPTPRDPRLVPLPADTPTPFERPMTPLNYRSASPRPPSTIPESPEQRFSNSNNDNNNINNSRTATDEHLQSNLPASNVHTNGATNLRSPIPHPRVAEFNPSSLPSRHSFTFNRVTTHFSGAEEDRTAYLGRSQSVDFGNRRSFIPDFQQIQSQSPNSSPPREVGPTTFGRGREYSGSSTGTPPFVTVAIHPDEYEQVERGGVSGVNGSEGVEEGSSSRGGYPRKLMKRMRSNSKPESSTGGGLNRSDSTATRRSVVSRLFGGKKDKEKARNGTGGGENGATHSRAPSTTQTLTHSEEGRPAKPRGAAFDAALR